MYLKYIRHKRPYGQLQRGTLYRVHFLPNAKGLYQPILLPISDVYETGSVLLSSAGATALLPAPLIYPAGMRCVEGRMRLSLGTSVCRSMLYLIDAHARDEFFTELYATLHEGHDVRIEVAET